MMGREKILKEAADIICKDRNDQYGEPEDSFRQIAEYWSDYLHTMITPKNVADMMALFKIGRATGVAYKRDTYLDAIGYLACGAEIAEKDLKKGCIEI